MNECMATEYPEPCVFVPTAAKVLADVLCSYCHAASVPARAEGHAPGVLDLGLSLGSRTFSGPKFPKPSER